MHRDVKPHNVMIEHEKRKVGCATLLGGSSQRIKCTAIAERTDLNPKRAQATLFAASGT